MNANHPEIAYYLPRFMGTLQLGNQTPATVPLLNDGASVTPEIVEAIALNAPAVHLPSSSIPPPEITPTVSDISSINLLTATHTPSSSIPPGTAATLGISAPGPLKGKKLDTYLHIVLENISAGFKQPNILDLKLGARLWDEDAKPEKRARLDKVAGETTSGSLGFRIAGMRVWQGDSKTPVVNTLEDVIKEQGNRTKHWSLDEESNHKSYNKFYGRQFTAEDVVQGFKEYLLVPSAGVNDQHASIVVSNFISELKDIQNIFESKESRMYSASILFVYEGHPVAFQEALEAIANAPSPKPEVDEDDEDEEEEERPRLYAVKLIDFAHARLEEGIGPDENMLAGVRSTISVLEKLLKEISE